MQNWLVKCLCVAVQPKQLTYPGRESKCLKTLLVLGWGYWAIHYTHDSGPAHDRDSIPLAMEIGSEKDGVLARPMDLSRNLSWHNSICSSMPAVSTGRVWAWTLMALPWAQSQNKRSHVSSWLQLSPSVRFRWGFNQWKKNHFQFTKDHKNMATTCYLPCDRHHVKPFR